MLIIKRKHIEADVKPFPSQISFIKINLDRFEVDEPMSLLEKICLNLVCFSCFELSTYL